MKWYTLCYSHHIEKFRPEIHLPCFYTYSLSMKVYVYYTCIGIVQQCGRASPCAALFVCLGTQKNSIRLVILRCLVGVFARSFIKIMTDAKSDQCTETLPSQTMNEYTNTHTPYASPWAFLFVPFLSSFSPFLLPAMRYWCEQKSEEWVCVRCKFYKSNYCARNEIRFRFTILSSSGISCCI